MPEQPAAETMPGALIFGGSFSELTQSSTGAAGQQHDFLIPIPTYRKFLFGIPLDFSAPPEIVPNSTVIELYQFSFTFTVTNVNFLVPNSTNVGLYTFCGETTKPSRRARHMKTFAYCRVSTERQNLKRQIDNISAAYPEIQERDFYTEKYTGTTSDRPEWQKLLERVKPGDTIVFDEVSRMSRDAEEGARQYEELYSKGVSLVFLKEPHINTDAYKAAAAASIPTTGNEIADIYIEATNKVLMILAKQQIQLAFAQAQKERDHLSKRTKEGIQAARRERIAQGKPPKATFNRGRKLETRKSRAVKAVILKHAKDFGGHLSDGDCILIAGCSRNSYYKYKAELRSSSAPMPGTDPDGQTSAEPDSPAV